MTAVTDTRSLCDTATYASRCDAGGSCEISNFGGNNHKYRPPQLVEVDYGEVQPAYSVRDVPVVAASAEPPAPIASRLVRRRGGMPMIERARRYLAATAPAIEGQRGDGRTFRVCCRLVGRFGLTDEDALSLLSEWNEGCRPPWLHGELVGKIKSARRHAYAAAEGGRDVMFD